MEVDIHKTQYSLDDLLTIMSAMRDEKSGCKWTQKQTWQSLVHHTIEEAYEIVDAVEKGDSADVKSELADMLNQIIFYSQIAKENHDFDFYDIVTFLAKKLISRHPNVFLRDGSETLTYGELEQQWEEIKNQEKHGKSIESILDGIVPSLSALSYAQKLQKKASSIGFDWSSSLGILPKLDEEMQEFKAAYSQDNVSQALEEIGDIMFTCVNLIRHLGADAETVMRKASKKFDARFRRLESIIDLGEQKNPSKETLEDAWRIAKMG